MADSSQHPAYCISMITRPERRAFCARQFTAEGLDVAFFDAITPADQENFPTRGTLGCFLSHIAVFEKVIDSGAEYVTVFEDDVLLPRGFGKMRQRVLGELAGRPHHVVYWGNMNALPPTPEPRCPSVVRFESDKSLIGTHAYTMRVATLRPLLEYLIESRVQRPAHIDGLFHMYRQAAGITPLGHIFKQAGQASFVSNITSDGEPGMLKNAVRAARREWQYLRR